MKSDDAWERSTSFIESELIPEMVFDRCFCEPNSREYVELVSVDAHLDELSRTSEIYRATVAIKFSDEARSFRLLIKLLPEVGGDRASSSAFHAFQNEEMFYSKMTSRYGTEYLSKCYLSDLGRYGRPVVVLEDLLAAGYKHVNGELDQDHLKLCLQVLAKFHARGLKLRATEPEIFREYQAKLLEISLTDEAIEQYQQRSSRMMDILESVPNSSFVETIKSRLNKTPMEMMKSFATDVNDVSTICHGHFSHDNLMFKYQNGKPIDAKVIDWQTMRYCSPAVDLGPILLYNVTHENGLSQVREILTSYIETAKSEYPELDDKRLREDIVEKFLYASVVLSLQEHITDAEFTRVLLLLEQLEDFC